MRQIWLKYGMLLTALFYIQAAMGQDSLNLKKLIWQKAGNCYSAFEDIDEDGTIDCELIDDTSNGYLTMKGWWPTCGCGCAATVGAYKDAEGNYTFLRQEYWKCEWAREFSSDRELSAVLPEAFGIYNFIPDLEIHEGDTTRYARFYIEAEIPRQGTDTKLTIKPIPFGLYIKSKNLLIYSIIEPQRGEVESEGSVKKSLYKIWDATLDHSSPKPGISLDVSNIPDKNLPYIDEIITDVIEKNNTYSSNLSEAEIKIHLTELKQLYKIYLLIEHETITLGWDKDKARFYIKEKGKRPEKRTFFEFLQNAEFWSGIC